MSDEKPKNNLEKNTWVEELEIASKDLVERVRELIEQGNVRRLIIRKKDGEVLLEVPLTASVIAGGALLVFTPLLAMLGVLAAFVAEVRLEVVREMDDNTPPQE
jgi:hypothetical protein